MRKLDSGDYRMIEYFHFEKGDVTRWSGWEPAIPVLVQEDPELYQAFLDYEEANNKIKELLSERLVEL